MEVGAVRGTSGTANTAGVAVVEDATEEASVVEVAEVIGEEEGTGPTSDSKADGPGVPALTSYDSPNASLYDSATSTLCGSPKLLTYDSFSVDVMRERIAASASDSCLASAISPRYRRFEVSAVDGSFFAFCAKICAFASDSSADALRFLALFTNSRNEG